MKNIKYILITLMALVITNSLSAQFFIGGSAAYKQYEHKITGTGVNEDYKLNGLALGMTTGYYFPFLRFHFDLDFANLKKNSDQAGSIEAGFFLDYYKFVSNNVMLYGGAGYTRLSLGYKEKKSSVVEKVENVDSITGELGLIYRLASLDLGVAVKSGLMPYEKTKDSFKSKITEFTPIEIFAAYVF